MKMKMMMMKIIKNLEFRRYIYNIKVGMWLLRRSYSTYSTKVRNESLIMIPGFGNKPKC